MKSDECDEAKARETERADASLGGNERGYATQTAKPAKLSDATRHGTENRDMLLKHTICTPGGNKPGRIEKDLWSREKRDRGEEGG